MGYNVSLRRNEARLLEVVPLAGFKSEQGASYHGTIDTRRVKRLFVKIARPSTWLLSETPTRVKPPCLILPPEPENELVITEV